MIVRFLLVISFFISSVAFANPEYVTISVVKGSLVKDKVQTAIHQGILPTNTTMQVDPIDKNTKFIIVPNYTPIEEPSLIVTLQGAGITPIMTRTIDLKNTQIQTFQKSTLIFGRGGKIDSFVGQESPRGTKVLTHDRLGVIVEADQTKEPMRRALNIHRKFGELGIGFLGIVKVQAGETILSKVIAPEGKTIKRVIDDAYMDVFLPGVYALPGGFVLSESLTPNSLKVKLEQLGLVVKEQVSLIDRSAAPDTKYVMIKSKNTSEFVEIRRIISGLSRDGLVYLAGSAGDTFVLEPRIDSALEILKKQLKDKKISLIGETSNKFFFDETCDLIFN